MADLNGLKEQLVNNQQAGMSNETRNSYVENNGRVKVAEAPSQYVYIAVLVSSIGAFVFGCSLGFTSPTMVANAAGKSSACPIMDCSGSSNSTTWASGLLGDSYPNGNCDNQHKMNCELHFSDNYQSLFGSIINFGCMAGALAGGKFVDTFGKKVGMIVSLAIYCVGWILVWLVPSPDTDHWDAKASTASNMAAIEAMLLIARLLLGFAVGIICCSVSNYQTEICTVDLRGAVGTVFQLFIVIGLFSVYLVGSMITWRLLAFICLVISAVGLVLTFFLVESPVWLLTKGRDEEAKAALRRLRAADVGDLDEQFDELLDNRDMDQEGGGDDDDNSDFGEPGAYSDDEKKKEAEGVMELYTDPTCRKALMIGVGLMFVQQLSGINAVMFYAGQIYGAVPGTSAATANTYSTGMQGMQVAITFSSAFFMDKAGRKPILLFAAIGQCACAFMLAGYYLFADCTKDPDGTVATASLGVFPVVALYGYVLFFSCGMGAIPWFIMGEIFKPSIKGVASSVATTVNWLLSFLITFSVSALSSAFKSMLSGALPNAIDTGMGGLFALYGTVCFLGVFFVSAMIPETKGKTIREVQSMLSGGKVAATGSRMGSRVASYQDGLNTFDQLEGDDGVGQGKMQFQGAAGDRKSAF